MIKKYSNNSLKNKITTKLCMFNRKRNKLSELTTIDFSNRVAL